MHRRAFTLIELLISIALTATVLLFLYKALATQEILNASLQRHTHRIATQEALFALLHRDLLKARSIQVIPLSNRDYSILMLQTTNSLHQIPMPYVAYFVHERNATLVRLESAYKFTFPVDFEGIKYIFADPLISQVNKFLVIQRQSGGKKRRQIPLPGERLPTPKEDNGTRGEYLIYLQWEDGKMVVHHKGM
ncbi:MAG: hypothetical protein C6I00_03330 [Nitratiruptor sp.]|nr:hypothetical protein [Nitratiruptor sp.]NPA83131.1 prepilin-type N-terminal cleavage/methylation domain-containing protein [Campylobacterota bacterium]